MTYFKALCYLSLLVCAIPVLGAAVFAAAVLLVSYMLYQLLTALVVG